MSSSANVKSIESIRDFRISLTNFSEDARNALSAVEMEVRRIRDWLQRDQFGYWQAQIKRRNELLAMARAELFRRRLSQSNSDAISDTEQKENVRIAQRRLEEAEDKLQTVKRWVPVLEHAIAEYHSASQPLGDRLTGSLQHSLVLLDRMLASLEAYLATAPPETPSVTGGFTSSGSATAVSTAPETVEEAVPAPAPAVAAPLGGAAATVPPAGPTS
jgi:hypothetical protein